MKGLEIIPNSIGDYLGYSYISSYDDINKHLTTNIKELRIISPPEWLDMEDLIILIRLRGFNWQQLGYRLRVLA